jgi:hypothetical protein
VKRRLGFLLVTAVAAGMHCGDSAPAVLDSADAAAEALAPSPEGGGLAEHCTAAILAEPRIATMYYVAIDEPGADNAACDGLAPSNEGNGRCPFKDLAPVAHRRLLEGVKAVRVELRAGLYTIDHDFAGLRLEGTGSSSSESVVLSAYGDEKPILAAPIRTAASCVPPDGGVIPAGCVRQILDVAGSFVVVQGLTIQDGLGYDVLVGGRNQLVRCNRLTYTTANAGPDGSGRSDALKLVGADIVVRHNELTNWESQAIDTAGSRGPLLIEENDIHDPHARGCGAVGIKHGGHDIDVRKNRIHHVSPAGCDRNRALLGGGGDGTDHPDEFSALRVHIVENEIWDANVRLAKFTSCLDCTFERNEVKNVLLGVFVTEEMTGKAECTASATGCRPTTNLRIVGNRIHGVHGGGVPEAVNFFIAVEDAADAMGLVVDANLYCVLPSATEAKFHWNGTTLTFDAWKSASGADATSTLVPTSDARCAF